MCSQTTAPMLSAAITSTMEYVRIALVAASVYVPSGSDEGRFICFSTLSKLLKCPA